MARQDELDKLRAKLGIGASHKPDIEEHPTPVGSPPPSPGAPAGEGVEVNQRNESHEEGSPLAPPPPENTDRISLTDLELVVEGEEPHHEGLDSPTGPPPPAPHLRQRPPEPTGPAPAGADAQSGPAIIVSASAHASEEFLPHAPLPETSAGATIQDWSDERAFYLREAEALGANQPEAASLMHLAAAQAAQLAHGDVQSHLQAALELASDNPLIVSLVREETHALGLYAEALDLTDKQVALGGDSTARVTALVEAAALARLRLRDNERALSYLQQALSLQPGHVIALATKAGLHLEQNDSREAAMALELLADVLTVPAERAICLYTAGSLREARLKEPEAAARDYAQASGADPGHLPALVALAAIQEDLAQWAPLAATLERLAQLDLHQLERARLLHLAGVVRLAHDDDLDAAARNLSTSASLAAEDPAPLSRLAHIFEITGRTEELVGVLRQRLELTPDARGQADLLTRIGWLLQDRLQRPQAAREAYGRALEARPGHQPAMRAVVALSRRVGDYEGLVELLHREAEGTGLAEQRAMRCVEAAEILARRLDRPQDAIAFYQRALQLDPTALHVFAPLRQLLEANGRFNELAALIRARISATSDDAARAHYLLDLARLQADRLERVDQAITTLDEMRNCAGSLSASAELVEIYARHGRHAELAELLVNEAGTAEDSTEAQTRLLEAARLLHSQLGEHDKAVELYQRVLDQNSACVAATDALAQIYHELGRWDDLAQLLRKGAETATTPHGAELWCTVGRLYDDDLGQPADAIAAYRRALTCDPLSATAMAALERLMIAEQRYEELIGLARDYGQACKEPVAAADALCRAAELATHRLNDLTLAGDLYASALDRHAGSTQALWGSYAVLRRQAKDEQAIEILRQLRELVEDATHLVHLDLQLARHKETRLGAAPDSASYEQAQQHGLAGGRLRLEQLRAKRATHDEQIAVALTEVGTQTVDPALASAYLLEAAQRYEVADAVDDQQVTAEQALTQEKQEPAVRFLLRRAYQSTSSWRELASLLEQEADRDAEPVARLRRLNSAAIAHVLAAQPDEAMRLAQRCLSGDASHLPSLRLVTRLLAAGENWAAQAEWNERLADACTSRQNRLVISQLASDTWAYRAGDEERGLASLRPALLDDPGQPEAFGRAERLLHQLGRFDQLSELYTHRIRHTEDLSQKIELLRLHAKLLQEKLGDAPRALGELSELLSLAPHDVGALVEAAELLAGLRRWSDAARTLETLVQRAPDATMARQARLQLARVCFDQLHDPELARRVLHEALDADPSDAEAKQLLVRVNLSEGHWAEAQHMLETLAASGDSAVGVWAMVRLADVAKTGFQDEELRRRWEQEALVLASSDEATLSELLRRYRERNEQQRLAETAENVLRETTNVRVVRTVRTVLSRLLVEDLHQPDRALEYLREAMIADPKSPTLNLLYGQALEQRGDSDDAVAIYRSLLNEDPTLLPAYRGLLQLAPMLGFPAVAAAAAAAVGLVGEATPSEESQLDSLENQGTPSGSLEMLPALSDPALRPMQELVELAGAHLGSLYRLPLAKEIPSSDPIRAAATQLAAVLGLSGPRVSVEGPLPVQAAVGQPISLQVAPRLARDPHSAAFRFWIGRALCAAAGAGALLGQLSDSEFDDLVDALCNEHPIDPLIQQLRKRVVRALPRRIRKRIDQMERPPMLEGIWARYRRAAEERADRVGLLLSGSPSTALAEIAGVEGLLGNPAGLNSSERLNQLRRFSVSEEYVGYHNAIWNAARG